MKGLAIPPRAFMFVIVAFILSFVLASLAFASLLALNFGLLIILGLSLMLVPIIAGYIVGYRGIALLILFFLVIVVGLMIGMVLPSGDSGILLIRSSLSYFIAAIVTGVIKK